MAIYSGNLITFNDKVLIKNVSAGPPPPEYFRTVYEVTPTVSKTFNCVWADKNSSQSFGKMYISRPNGLYVIDLSKKIVYQHVTPFENNVTGEILEQSDIVDININT